jgi:ketosteroid isomerase-like protein
VTQAVTTATETDAILRRLLDESEIRAVLARYARGIDHNDADVVRSCYHEDATDAHGHYNGSIDGFLAYSAEWADQIESMTHHFGQSCIELDGDSAWVESYCLCLIRMRPEDGAQPMDRLANIRYVDLFERRDGVWRIARRKVVHHPSRLDPVEVVVPLAEQAMLARPDRDDPSYDRRPESFLP